MLVATVVTHANLEYAEVHVVLCLGRRSVFGVTGWMNDAIHVQVEMIEFAIRVGLRGVHRNLDTTNGLRACMHVCERGVCVVRH